MRTPINVTLTAAALCLLSTPALAGPSTDVGVDILTPASELVYDASAIDILVENTSNRRANDVVLSVSLPETNTSPTVHVMGSLSAVDPACVQTGTQLSCALGRLDAGDSVVVSFDIALPQADQVLEIAASVSTSSTDNNAANDSDTEVPALDNYAVSVSPGDVATNRHCTGQGLTSFFECALFPSSISQHDVEFLANGDLTIPGQPGYDGSWSQPSPETLEFHYELAGDVVLEFFGYGTSGNCFEGISTFPGSPWVAPYQVCI